jgi:hypothetical protein
MAAPPPAWFSAVLDELAALGLPPLDEYRRDDVWGRWEDRWGDRSPAAAGVALARAIALYPGRVWSCETPRASQGAAGFAGWLAALAAISGGALVVGDVEEVWSRGTSVVVRFAANGGWFELLPRHVHGRGLLRELLDAAHAAAEHAVFRELAIERGGREYGDDDEDDDDGADHTVVCVPHDAGRVLAARGVRFVEPDRPVPGRLARLLGLTASRPRAVEPVTMIRRVGDRPLRVTAPPPAPAPAAETPLLSEIVGGAGVVARLTEAIRPHARPTWTPITEPGDPATQASKFGGAPWMTPRERIPRCASCEQPMPLAVQLDLEALPAELRGTGLLQCFVCLEDREACARVVTTDRRVARASAAGLPARAVVGWADGPRELPGPAHWEPLGIALDARAAAVAEDELDPPGGGDKLGGFPAHIQDPDLGRCERCGRPRALLIQLSGRRSLAVDLGDHGRLFVAICRDHPDAALARIESC